MTLTDFHKLNEEEQKELLTKCCGSSSWVNKMLAAAPFEDLEEVFIKAQSKWNECKKQDWLEAFEHHPKIGDINSLKEKFANTAQWAQGEQAAVAQTSQEVLEALAELNKAYEEKFGFIFIVCATGKSAEKMLSILQLRLQNHPEEEIKIAAAEQGKITRLRLEKLFAEEAGAIKNEKL